MSNLTDGDRELLNSIRALIGQAAGLMHQAHNKGFVIAFAVNGPAGTVERFEVSRMVPVDFKGGTN